MDTNTILIAVVVAVGIATVVFEVLYLGAILRGISVKMGADDAAIFLQDKRVEEVLRLMREELMRR